MARSCYATIQIIRLVIVRLIAHAITGQVFHRHVVLVSFKLSGLSGFHVEDLLAGWVVDAFIALVDRLSGFGALAIKAGADGSWISAISWHGIWLGSGWCSSYRLV